MVFVYAFAPVLVIAAGAWFLVIRPKIRASKKEQPVSKPDVKPEEQRITARILKRVYVRSKTNDVGDHVDSSNSFGLSIVPGNTPEDLTVIRQKHNVDGTMWNLVGVYYGAQISDFEWEEKVFDGNGKVIKNPD